MAHAVSPSNGKTLTKGQAGKFSNLLVSALVKSALPSEPTQDVLEEQGKEIVTLCVALIRKRVELKSGLVVRTVKVNRKRSGAEAVDATGRKFYGDNSVVASMPNGTEEEVEIIFFNPGRYLKDDDEARAEYNKHELDPVDPYALCDFNGEDPAFADTHPNATIWDGNCYAAFYDFFDGRRVDVNRDDYVWHGDWWFAGVRKCTPISSPQL